MPAGCFNGYYQSDLVFQAWEILLLNLNESSVFNVSVIWPGCNCYLVCRHVLKCLSKDIPIHTNHEFVFSPGFSKKSALEGLVFFMVKLTTKMAPCEIAAQIDISIYFTLSNSNKCFGGKTLQSVLIWMTISEMCVMSHIALSWK